MATTSRRRSYWPLALRWFRAQSYPNARLFILSDGEGFGPFVGDVGLLKHGQYPSLGEKFNALHAWAIEEGAEWFSAWSDDDWQSPESISERMQWANDGVQRLGHGRLWIRDLTDGRGADGHVITTDYRRGWVSPISHLYHREVWEKSGGYPSLDVGEDTGFQRRLDRWSVATWIPEKPTQVVIRHGANSWTDELIGFVKGERFGDIVGDAAATAYEAARKG